MKLFGRKTITPISVSVAVFALAASGICQTTPVFEYNFPASWAGSGTTVTDQSAAGNNGTIQGTLSLSASVPSGAAGGTQSITTSSGGFRTTATGLLNNSLVAAAGGFSYDVAFNWDGTDTSASFGGAEKIIDYAGTESLQLLVTGAGTADLVVRFDDSVNALSTPISPNTWYSVSVRFDTQGNAVDGSGNLDGIVSMSLNGDAPITAAATKTAQGDNLNRTIAVGELSVGTYLVGFKGQIYDPSVSLGVVPEPSTVALGVMGALTFLGVSARRRLKK